MPLNRATLIRISTIDRCLQNHYRRWTIGDLIDACTEALAEYEGRSNPVSRRTFQNDLALMRSDRLGYNAPIVVRENKYYEYEDPDFSITHLPLSDEGLDALNSALDILRQLQGFPQLESSIDTISKLNEQISRHTGTSAPAMDLEHVPDYQGAKYIGTIYEAVRKKQTLVIEYKSFKARHPGEVVVYPYLLKEYRNRWFLIGERRRTGCRRSISSPSTESTRWSMTTPIRSGNASTSTRLTSSTTRWASPRKSATRRGTSS